MTVVTMFRGILPVILLALRHHDRPARGEIQVIEAKLKLVEVVADCGVD